MRLEVIIGDEQPVIYPLSESKLLIGSGETSHIVIPAAAGISRKHLQITCDADKYYATDLGSKNGSYLNGTQMIPGSKVEFTSFFPLRLGENVFISLISDEEAGEEQVSSLNDFSKPAAASKPEATKVISLSSLQQSATSKPQVSRTSAPKSSSPSKVKKVADKKTGKKKDDNKMLLVKVGAVLIAAAAGFTQYLDWKDAQEQAMVPETPDLKIELKRNRPDKPAAPAADAKSVSQIPAEEFPTAADMRLGFQEFRCTLNLEKKLCELFPTDRGSITGVVELKDKILFFYPEEELYLQARTEAPQAGFTTNVRNILLFMFFLEKMNMFDWKEIEKNLFFFFYEMREGYPVVITSVAVHPREIQFLHEKSKGFRDKFLNYRHEIIFEMEKHLKIVTPLADHDVARPVSPNQETATQSSSESSGSATGGVTGGATGGPTTGGTGGQ